MTDKQIIKQLVERYKEICRSPFADGYTFRAFDGECAEKGFTSDDIKNYIEKEKQERKAKRTESIKSLKEQLKRKEQECEELREERNEYFELMAIRTEILAKIANKLGMNTGIIENKELFYRINQLKIENEELKKTQLSI